MFTIQNTPELSLGEMLGKGTYGAVYSATFKGKVVAVKQIFDAVPGQHLEREIRMLKKLPVHPGLPVFVDAFADGFAMELIDGMNLRKILSHRIVSWTSHERFEISRQLAEAVTMIHNAGIVHCDLKLSNIMIKSNGTIVVTDFGLAVSARYANKYYRYCGTAIYIAPEVISERVISFESDIYSLAMILWSLHLGEEPRQFKEMKKEALHNAVCNKTRPSMEETEINPVYAMLIMRCWSHLPQDRMSALNVASVLSQLVLAEEAVREDDSYVNQIRRFSLFHDPKIALWKAIKNNNLFLVRKILFDDNFDRRWLKAAIKKEDKNHSLLLTALRSGSLDIVDAFIHHPYASTDLFLLRDDISQFEFMSTVMLLGYSKLAKYILSHPDFTEQHYDILFHYSGPDHSGSTPRHWMEIAVMKEADTVGKIDNGHRECVSLILNHVFFEKIHLNRLFSSTGKMPHDCLLANSLIYQVHKMIRSVGSMTGDNHLLQLFERCGSAYNFCCTVVTDTKLRDDNVFDDAVQSKAMLLEAKDAAKKYLALFKSDDQVELKPISLNSSAERILATF